MEIHFKLGMLETIYRLFDEFTASQEQACKKGCAHCCTTSVTLTTIEGYQIIEQLKTDMAADWEGKIHQASEQAHFRPKMTTNQLAQRKAFEQLHKLVGEKIVRVKRELVKNK